MTVYTDTLEDFITNSVFLEEQHSIQNTDLTDSVDFAIYFLPGDIYLPNDIVSVAWSVEADDTVETGETNHVDYGFLLSDAFSATDTHALKMFYNDLLTDRVRMRESILRAFLASLSETVTAGDVLTAVRAAAIIEALRLTDAIAPSFKYGLTVLERATLYDSLARFFSGSIVDSISTSSTITTQMRALRVVAENVSISLTQAQKLVFRVEAADDLSLEDTDVLKLIYSGQITEGVEISAGYISPDGNFTAWSINTKNFATTEYTNFAFNSFAQMGNKYVAADSTGIYELLGDTDNGDAIIAQIRSGFAQFAGSRFSGIKAIYLGMRGSGSFVLKVETGDDKVYNYAVTGKNMQTARVHLGKGLRARYFSFELISTGQDFDLDDVEFMPLAAQRRV